MEKILPRLPFERILKKVGAKRVSQSALEELARVIEDKLIEISKEAVALAKHAGRKTVMAEDIRLAYKRFRG
ncbi:MAG TPA: histone family protein [Candidatus Aenigmarchaeota archaeon]|nr:histone family protein [Candidatus Aenigmarchaeota archaeon]